MFDELILSGKMKKTHKSWTVLLSTIVQFIILGVMVLIPLIYTEALPKLMSATFLAAPPPPPPPPPPAAIVKTVKVPKVIQLNKMVAPTVIPKNIAVVKDDGPPAIYTNDLSAGVAGGLGDSLGSTAGGPPPPPKPVVKAPLRVGGNVMTSQAISTPQPPYPTIAKAARIQGTVVLHAIISKDGTIEQLTLVSGPPLLVQPTMDAVRQWRYRPTMLNGEPTDVDTTISVTYSLGG
jgi:protein TonB